MSETIKCMVNFDNGEYVCDNVDMERCKKCEGFMFCGCHRPEVVKFRNTLRNDHPSHNSGKVK